MTLRFDHWRASLPLWCRLSAAFIMPLIFALSSLQEILFSEWRWNHAIGGFMLLLALRGGWNALDDAIIFWGVRHERNYVRPPMPHVPSCASPLPERPSTYVRELTAQRRRRGLVAITSPSEKAGDLDRRDLR